MIDCYRGVRTSDFADLHANMEFAWIGAMAHSLVGDEDTVLKVGVQTLAGVSHVDFLEVGDLGLFEGQ